VWREGDIITVLQVRDMLKTLQRDKKKLNQSATVVTEVKLPHCVYWISLTRVKYANYSARTIA
jgi:hypothetical protein